MEQIDEINALSSELNELSELTQLLNPFRSAFDTLSTKQRKALQQLPYREFLRIRGLLDPDFKEQRVFGMMSALVKKARYQVNAESMPDRLLQLLALMYDEWGFHTPEIHSFKLGYLSIDEVLCHRTGSTSALGSILLYLAAALDIPLYPVNFPTQLVVRIDLRFEEGRVERQYINPTNGMVFTFEELEKLIEGEFGFATPLKREMLEIATTNELVERIETIFKMSLTSEGMYEEALQMIEYRLSANPEDPYEIRDRGMILASLDCYQAALDDFNYFIDQCPDDPSATLLKLELKGIEQRAKDFALH